MVEPRLFDLHTLDALANSGLRPAIGVGGALVWRYTLLFPIGEGQAGEQPAAIAGAAELCNEVMLKLAEHFRGLTVLPPLQGYGLRNADDPSSIETNINWPLVIYAAPVAASDKYMETLQEGVRGALHQGLVLLERQDVFLLGEYFTGTMSLLNWTPWQPPGPLSELPPPHKPS
jgi:hypothetical protein